MIKILEKMSLFFFIYELFINAHIYKLKRNLPVTVLDGVFRRVLRCPPLVTPVWFRELNIQITKQYRLKSTPYHHQHQAYVACSAALWVFIVSEGKTFYISLARVGTASCVPDTGLVQDANTGLRSSGCEIEHHIWKIRETSTAG